MDGRVAPVALGLHRQEAGVAVPLADAVLERRILGGAAAEDLWAARGEVAPARQRDQRGRLTLDRRQPAGPHAVEPRDRAKQSPGVRVLRVVEDLSLVALLHHPTPL